MVSPNFKNVAREGRRKIVFNVKERGKTLRRKWLHRFWEGRNNRWLICKILVRNDHCHEEGNALAKAPTEGGRVGIEVEHVGGQAEIQRQLGNIDNDRDGSPRETLDLKDVRKNRKGRGNVRK